MKKTIEKLTLKHRRPDVFNLLQELGCEYIGIEEIPLEKIIIDQGIYPREKTDKERVSIYATNMLNGDIFPPILTSSDYTKLDGNHRYYAHKEAEKTTIWIEKWEVPEGLYPVVAQAVNTEEKEIDTPLTPTEKKRAILRDWEILTQYDKKTRKQIIAKVLKTQVEYVNKVLSEAGILKSEKEELRQKIIDLDNQGFNQIEIAGKLGINQSTVSRVLKDYAKFTQVKNAYSTPRDLAIQLHNEGLRYEEIQQKILEETGQEIPINTLIAWVAEHKGKFWDATGWGKPVQTETQPEPEEYEEEDLQHTEEQFLQEYQEELTIDPTTEEIKQIISEMRKKGYNKFQIVKYLVDGEDIDGYTFDQIAKAFDTDTASIEELYNEALEMGIKTPRPYQKGKAGRKPKDTSTAFDHEAQFEEQITTAISTVAHTLAYIANTWGQDYAEKALARIKNWIETEAHEFCEPLKK